MKRIDLTGKKFNLLTAEGIAKIENGKVFWNCICDCGNKTIVYAGNLRTGAVKSCGCLRQKAYNKTHGDSKTPLYRHWHSMVYRCTNPKSHAYKWYGGRGIKVCDEWLSYEAFKEWALKTRPNDTYTVERIDVNGNYSPDNCKWIPMSEQANNRTSCLIFEKDGISKNLTEWCNDLGIDYKLVHNRLFKLGWKFEKAISEPVDATKRKRK